MLADVFMGCECTVNVCSDMHICVCGIIGGGGVGLSLKRMLEGTFVRCEYGVAGIVMCAHFCHVIEKKSHYLLVSNSNR